METERKIEVYVLGCRICFGEMSICGVYTSKVKLMEGYQRIMDEKAGCSLFSGDPPEVSIYRFHANEFLGEFPEWNFGELYVNEKEYEISIQEVQEQVEI